jgi:predicted RND superfamily exporter protein
MTARRYTEWLLRHARVVLLVAGVLALVTGVRAAMTYANLKSDLEELLPTKAPSVAALAEARKRLPGLRHLGVVVDTGGRANTPAALRFLDDLAGRIRAYPPDVVADVRTGVARERHFFETFGLQLLEPADVHALREAVAARHRWEIAHRSGLSLLDEDEDPPPALPIAELEQKYVARFGRPPSFPHDRFVSEDGRTAVLVVRASAQTTGLGPDQDLLERVKRDVAALGFPAAYSPGLRVGYAGDVATRVEEAHGLVVDLGLASVAVLALVFVVIAWFFRGVAAVPVLVVPVLFGALYTFGLVALPPLSIRSLNSNTAFLSSIIVGNGINSGIILLARYREEIGHGLSRERALAAAVSETWRATLGAALAACAAYGSLIATDFRGFRQFGFIGALGMLACWAATYVLVPPLVMTLGSRLAPPVRRARPPLGRRLFAFVLGRPRSVLAVTGALLCLGLLGLFQRRNDWLETDFSRLRRADSFVNGERYWGKRMDATLHSYLTPAVVLADSADSATRIAAELQEVARRGGAGGLIASVRSSETVLPKSSGEALREARALRDEVTPAMLSTLSPEDRARVGRLLSDEALRPLTPRDVPPALALGLEDRSGALDRNVLVFPKLGAGTWDAGRMGEFARDLRGAVEASGGQGIAVGSLLLSSDIIAAMRRDGPIATSLALGAVTLTAILAFRAFGLSLAAVASLLLGVVLMLGCAAWTGQRLNFSNLIALPITFGVAADYSINVLKRFQAGSGFGDALASTGSAVALCSATTIIGFGSLVIAQNRALASFGSLAIIGELACLLTAVVVVPAYFAWRGMGPTDTLATESHAENPT